MLNDSCDGGFGAIHNHRSYSHKNCFLCICLLLQGPKVSPGFSGIYGQACQSHPSLYISVPHHLKFFISPGYMNPKNTTTSENANPESRAADIVIVYLPHQAEARLRTRWLKLKQTTAQIEKLRPVAGGIQLKLPNRTGRFTLRRMLFFRRFAIMNRTMGATAPIRKAQTKCR